MVSPPDEPRWFVDPDATRVGWVVGRSRGAVRAGAVSDPWRMARQRIPDESSPLPTSGRGRASARDWAEADRLRAEIEAAGWKVVDRGTDFALSRPQRRPSPRATVVRYGSSEPCRRGWRAPATGLATVVLVATDWPDDLARALAGLARARARGDVDRGRRRRAVGATQARGAAGAEVRRTSPSRSSGPASGSAGAALNIGLRRATGPVVVIARHERRADRRPRHAARRARSTTRRVARRRRRGGSSADDLRKFEDAPAGDVDAIEGYAQAFRRADACARGPLDERFRFYRNLDIWWSLVLRDEGEGSRRAGRSRSPICRRSGTSIAAGRASPTPSATARASATSTGSSTGSAGARDLLRSS